MPTADLIDWRNLTRCAYLFAVLTVGSPTLGHEISPMVSDGLGAAAILIFADACRLEHPSFAASKAYALNQSWELVSADERAKLGIKAQSENGPSDVFKGAKSGINFRIALSDVKVAADKNIEVCVMTFSGSQEAPVLAQMVKLIGGPPAETSLDGDVFRNIWQKHTAVGDLTFMLSGVPSERNDYQAIRSLFVAKE